MTVKDKPYTTLEEFEALTALPEYRDRLLELVHGEIIEKVPTEEHGTIVFIIAGELYIYLKDKPTGRAGVEVRHKKPGDQYNARIPDLSYTRDVSKPLVTTGSVPRMPDLAVEIKSPDDTY